MIGLIQVEQAIASAISIAQDVQIYDPENEGERILAKALRGIFSDLDRAMKVFHGHPSAPERHRRLDSAIRSTHAARFIALAKAEPNEQLANRIEELRERIARARRM